MHVNQCINPARSLQSDAETLICSFLQFSVSESYAYNYNVVVPGTANLAAAHCRVLPPGEFNDFRATVRLFLTFRNVIAETVFTAAL